MQHTELKAIEAMISPARLQPYRDCCDGQLSTSLQLYRWNTEVSAAFYPLLQSLEVALRNAIHDQLRTYLGRQDWWESTKITWDEKTVNKIKEAKKSLKKRPPVCDDMVANLSFGFWVALTGRTHDYETQLWRPCLHRAFPHHPRVRGDLAVFRKQVNKDLKNLGWLRNRIAHHEPIHRRRLQEDRRTILRTLGYLSPEKQTWVQVHDRLPELLAARPSINGNKS